jgi:hypothetical protein
MVSTRECELAFQGGDDRDRADRDSGGLCLFEYLAREVSFGT